MIALAAKQLLDKPIVLALNSVLIALSSAMLMTWAVLSGHLGERFSRDTANVDLVVGAKGSPLQVILSTLYHVDTPTGNIPGTAIAVLEKDPTVKSVVPIAIGDRFRSYRVVGTRSDYLRLYGAELAQGKVFEADDEAVIGAQVAEALAMRLDQAFVLSHGLSDASSTGHDHHPLRVTGILKPTGSVIDRLVLTPLEAVWEAHGIDAPTQHHGNSHDEDDHDHGAPHHDDGHAKADDEDEHTAHGRPNSAANATIAPEQTPDVTALLVQYASPLAAVRLPQFINTQTPYVAAVPARETARLLTLFGFGQTSILLISGLLTGLGALAIFTALWSTLEHRMADMAMLRVLGARPLQVFCVLLWEGVITAGIGAVLGFALTRGILLSLVRTQSSLAESGLSASSITAQELWIIAGITLLGGLAALIPAISAARVPIARALGNAG